MKGNSCSIALVDDDAPVLKGLSRLLRGRGFEVSTYGSAEDFLARGSAGLPDCLIVDQRMPGMTGLELLQQLAQQGIRISAIVITAYGDPLMYKRCVEAGAIACLAKPLQLPALLAAIATACRGSGVPGQG